MHAQDDSPYPWGLLFNPSQEVHAARPRTEVEVSHDHVRVETRQ
ncbi:unannotated protein [freshwater metagenome]|uniref:Unannotated protein n=1 Tax=freshwater metagenome TaxID=449393 RepID=A0A6J7RAQ8_9ZZZZ